MIIFVGDQPSRKNIHPDVAFVGTQSYKRLLEWIWQMDISINDVKIINKDKIKETLKEVGSNTYYANQWIALGDKASKVLCAYGKGVGVYHFKLPHPSGLNRKLNNKRWLNSELRKCKKWIAP